MKDIGPKPNAFDIEEQTLTNDNYRKVIWTGEYLQVTLMSIEPGKDIGLEAHPQNDQFLRLEQGTGLCQMGDSKDNLSFEQEVKDDWAIVIPAGKWHNITNTGDEPLKLYSVYSPVHHAADITQPTFDDAEKDEESGIDEPPEWAFKLPNQKDDKHA
ncbi:cupin domain-containing protein [Moraxella nasovis]|uniref:cupin domain-containing protein n=1 Tax=Moraxella nasovis TaxID=2904121 RepID=UPI001F61DAC1|nr:cupin domain-containing protein [Moraxella nasovis]UNU72687.1 cupin domain-containing protein [Moraxella nasovis]